MQLGNRLFPYPLLNNAKELSEFKESSSFELKITLTEDGDIIKDDNYAILKDVHFVLNDDDLYQLYKEKKIKCYLIVESPSSVYRERYELTDQPQTINIRLASLKDDVYVSSYCVALCDIDNYSSKNFDDDYDGYTFDIKKYDIIAADDGIKFSVERNLNEDNKVSSIFLIIPNESETKMMTYEMRTDRIYIYLPVEPQSHYKNLSGNSDWNDVFFAMMAIPVLASCFSDIKKEMPDGEYSIQDIEDNFKWFRSISKSYKKEKGQDLTSDDFDNTPALELAQTVFNYSTINGIESFCNLIIGRSNEVDE